MKWMSNEEILRSYRQAKNPRNQIKILAELNLCDRAEIVQTLKECGVDPKELPNLPRYQRGSAYTPTKEEAAPQSKPTRRWVWVGTKKDQELDERIRKAKERYEFLKKAHGESDPYVVGFKACINFMEA